MTSWILSLALLAADEPAQQQPAPPFGISMLPLVAIGIMFYILFVRGPSRDQARRNETLNALKKNDRVVTIGGIIGTISQISDDKQRITLKVDDNTKITFERSAIRGVVNAEDDASKSSSPSAT